MHNNKSPLASKISASDKAVMKDFLFNLPRRELRNHTAIARDAMRKVIQRDPKEDPLVRSGSLTSKQMDYVQRQFSFLDANGDGYLDENEFTSPLTYVMEPELAHILFNAFDLKGNGKIDRDAFCACMKLFLSGSAADQMQFGCRLFHKDDEGRVSHESYKTICMYYTGGEREESLVQVWAALDPENKGYVDGDALEAELLRTGLEEEQNPLRRPGESMDDSKLPLLFGSPEWKIIMPLFRAIQCGLRTTPPDCRERAMDVNGIIIWEYEPAKFAELRKVFGLTPDKYLQSLGIRNLIASLLLADLAIPKPLSATGKSGGYFFMAHDGSLIVKSIMENEAMNLIECLPSLLQHFKTYPNSLITKFCGLFKSSEGDTWFIVMQNVMPPNVSVKTVYDLKGSAYHRSTPMEKRTSPFSALKDLDLPEPLVLVDQQEHTLLMSQIERDAAWLETQEFVDYSLLVMIAVPRDDVPTSQSVAAEGWKCFHSRGQERFYIGVIDVLTKFNAIFALATKVKNELHENPSWQPPPQYSKRFVAHMQENVFRLEG